MKERKITPKKLKCFEIFLKNEERGNSTLEKYMRDVKRFSVFLGDTVISKAKVMEYKSYLGENYAVASGNSMIAALNSFLRFCGWQELCVKQFRLQRQAYCPEEKELSREEYIRLLKAATAMKNERLNLIIQTICATGIRVSELRYITVESVYKGEAAVNCKGKNRRIFIVPDLKRKLLKYIKERKIKSGAVFITKRGKCISRHSIWREMKGLCKEARVGWEKVFPHNLRHLFARTFYGIEKDIAKLADILGHASINTTRIYIVTTGTEHKRKMENMRLII